MAGIIKRLSRFFVNKKLLCGLLEEEMSLDQVDVNMSEEEVVLHDVTLRADVIDSLLPAGCPVRLVSIRMTSLRLKLPSLSSGWMSSSASISSDVTPVSIIGSGLDVTFAARDDEDEAPSPRTPAPSNPAMSDSLAHRLELGGAAAAGGKNRQANFEDCPDAPPSPREGGEEREGEGERGAGGAGGGGQRGGTREELVRYLEKVFSATELTLTEATVRLRTAEGEIRLEIPQIGCFPPDKAGGAEGGGRWRAGLMKQVGIGEVVRRIVRVPLMLFTASTMPPDEEVLRAGDDPNAGVRIGGQGAFEEIMRVQGFDVGLGYEKRDGGGEGRVEVTVKVADVGVSLGHAVTGTLLRMFELASGTVTRSGASTPPPVAEGEQSSEGGMEDSGGDEHKGESKMEGEGEGEGNGVHEDGPASGSAAPLASLSVSLSIIIARASASLRLLDTSSTPSLLLTASTLCLQFGGNPEIGAKLFGGGSWRDRVPLASGHCGRVTLREICHKRRDGEVGEGHMPPLLEICPSPGGGGEVGGVSIQGWECVREVQGVLGGSGSVQRRALMLQGLMERHANLHSLLLCCGAPMSPPPPEGSSDKGDESELDAVNWDAISQVVSAAALSVVSFRFYGEGKLVVSGAAVRAYADPVRCLAYAEAGLQWAELFAEPKKGVGVKMEDDEDDEDGWGAGGWGLEEEEEGRAGFGVGGHEEGVAAISGGGFSNLELSLDLVAIEIGGTGKVCAAIEAHSLSIGVDKGLVEEAVCVEWGVAKVDIGAREVMWIGGRGKDRARFRVSFLKEDGGEQDGVHGEGNDKNEKGEGWMTSWEGAEGVGAGQEGKGALFVEGWVGEGRVCVDVEEDCEFIAKMLEVWGPAIQVFLSSLRGGSDSDSCAESEYHLGDSGEDMAVTGHESLYMSAVNYDAPVGRESVYASARRGEIDSVDEASSLFQSVDDGVGEEDNGQDAAVSAGKMPGAVDDDDDDDDDDLFRIDGSHLVASPRHNRRVPLGWSRDRIRACVSVERLGMSAKCGGQGYDAGCSDAQVCFLFCDSSVSRAFSRARRISINRLDLVDCGQGLTSAASRPCISDLGGASGRDDSLAIVGFSAGKRHTTSSLRMRLGGILAYHPLGSLGDFAEGCRKRVRAVFDGEGTEVKDGKDDDDRGVGGGEEGGLDVCVSLSDVGCVVDGGAGGGQCVVASEKMHIEATIPAGEKGIVPNFEFRGSNFRLLLIDDVAQLRFPPNSPADGGAHRPEAEGIPIGRYLYQAGYVRIAALEHMKLTIKQANDGSASIFLRRARLHIGACADSISTLAHIISYASRGLSSSSAPQPPPPSKRASCAPLKNPGKQPGDAVQPLRAAGRGGDGDWEDVGPLGGGLSMDYNYDAGIRQTGDVGRVEVDFFDRVRIKNDEAKRRKALEGGGARDLEIRMDHCELSFTVYGGSDWCPERPMPRGRRKKAGGEGEGVKVSDCGDIITVSSGAGEGARSNGDGAAIMEGGGGRDTDTWVQLRLKGVRMHHAVFAQGHGDKTCISVGEFEVLDGVPSSSFSRVLSRLNSPPASSAHGHLGRNRDSLSVSLLSLPKSFPTVHVRVALAPIELNLDQDTAHFLLSIAGDSSDSSSSQEGDDDFASESDAFDVGGDCCPATVCFEGTSVKLNLKHRKLETGKIGQGDAGQLIGLLMFLYGSELPPLHIPRAVFVDQLSFEAIAQRYMHDSSPAIRTQIRKASAMSLPVLRNTLSVGRGVIDLIMEPINDKHKLRGVRNGASSFSRSVAFEALDMASVVLCYMTAALCRAEGVLGGGGGAGGVTPEALREAYAAVKPETLREGLVLGYGSAKQGLRSGFAQVKRLGGGGGGGGRGIMEGTLPTGTLALLAPTRGLVGAVQATLIGAKNALRAKRS